MLYEKKKLLIHRIIWFILLLLVIIVSIIMSDEIWDYDTIVIILFIHADIFIPIIFIVSLFLSYKSYRYNGDFIVVYSGWFHHYIKVNGTKMDEHNTLQTFIPILLTCTLDDGTDLEATITLTNRISLKINNQLYTKGEIK